MNRPPPKPFNQTVDRPVQRVAAGQEHDRVEIALYGDKRLQLVPAHSRGGSGQSMPIASTPVSRGVALESQTRTPGEADHPRPWNRGSDRRDDLRRRCDRPAVEIRRR